MMEEQFMPSQLSRVCIMPGVYTFLQLLRWVHMGGNPISFETDLCYLLSSFQELARDVLWCVGLHYLLGSLGQLSALNMSGLLTWILQSFGMECKLWRWLFTTSMMDPHGHLAIVMSTTDARCRYPLCGETSEIVLYMVCATFTRDFKHEMLGMYAKCVKYKVSGNHV